MENYVKGKNVEQEDILDNDIISHLPPTILSSQASGDNCTTIYDKLSSRMCWMHMRGGSKLRNFIGPCMNSLNSCGFVIISGSGPAVTKVVSCTEIVKRRYRQSKPPIYQLTKISYRTFEEHWDPKTEDLEPLKVTREIPQIDVLLKKQTSDGCDNSKINMNNPTLDVFLNITPVKNNLNKRKKLKSKSGKRTGTSTTGRLDAATELGLVNKGHGHGGGNKKSNVTSTPQNMNRTRQYLGDSNTNSEGNERSKTSENETNKDLIRDNGLKNGKTTISGDENKVNHPVIENSNQC